MFERKTQRRILRTKTGMTAVAAVATSIAGAYTGEMTNPEAIQLAFTALLGIFLRHTMAKQDPDNF